MNPLDFTGKTVLVVGGSSGIGNGIARGFLRHGADVHVWGTRPGIDDYNVQDGSDLSHLHYACVDVREPIAIERWSPPFDKLDVLIQSQGITIPQPGEFAAEGWNQVVQVNLNSLMLVATKFRPHLSINGGGSIVIVSSISGFQANAGNPAYSASKAGAISLTRVLGKAWASEGIRVNGLAPGYVSTKLTTSITAERLGRLRAAIPNGRPGTPEDMAGVALFLASSLAGYVTGHTVVVDGGLSLS